MKKILGLLLFLTVGFSQAPVTPANLPYYIGELYFNRTHLDSLLPADSSSIYIEGYTAMDSTGIDGLGFVPDLEFTEFKDAIDDSISDNVDSTFIDNLNFIPDLQLANVTNVATSDDAYDATNWDGNLDAATKNAIRDKIETLPGGHDPVTLNVSATTGGMSISTQEISNRAATNLQTGYITAAFIQNIETNNAKVTDTVPDSSDIDALNFIADLELTDYLLKAADRDSNTVHLAFAVTGNIETGITVTAPGDGTLDFVVTGAPPTLIIRDGGTPITGTPSDLDFLGADFVLSDVAKSDSVEISIADSGIDHDQTTNFVAAKHYDWTQDLGATNIHSGNYNDTQLDSSGVDALNFIPDLELTNYLLKASVGDSITTRIDSTYIDGKNFVPDLELINYTLLSVLQDTFDVHIVGFTEDSDTSSSWLATKTNISDLNIGDYLLKTAVGDTVTTRIDSTYIDGKNFVADLEFTNHTGTDHLFESELDDFSELQTQISDKTLVNEEDIATIDANWVNTANPWAENEIVSTVIVESEINTFSELQTFSVDKTLVNEEDDFTITGLYVFSDSAYIDTLQFGIIYGGTIKSGTWNGTAISDSYIDNNITITNLSGINTGDSDIMEGGVSVSTAPNYLDFLDADFNLSDGTTADSVTVVINDGGINHDNTANYSANKHIDHTGVDFTAGDGLRGGGTIASNRTFIVNLDFDGGLETTDDSINVKLDGSTLSKGVNGLKVNSITASLVSDFDTEVANNSAVSTNTSKVTDDDIGVAEVYHITNWDADTGSPQKNDLRDYFASFDTDGDGDIDNFDATNLASAVSPLTLTALQVDNISINANTISSTAGTDLIITPLAGQDIILDGHWQFDGADLTALTDNNTIINAYSGKNITIESVTFDGGDLTATILASTFLTVSDSAFIDTLKFNILYGLDSLNIDSLNFVPDLEFGNHRDNSGTDHSLLGATAGTATASKALIVDASKDINLGTGDISATLGTFSGDVTINGNHPMEGHSTGRNVMRITQFQLSGLTDGTQITVTGINNLNGHTLAVETIDTDTPTGGTRFDISADGKEVTVKGISETLLGLNCLASVQYSDTGVSYYVYARVASGNLHIGLRDLATGADINMATALPNEKVVAIDILYFTGS